MSLLFFHVVSPVKSLPNADIKYVNICYYMVVTGGFENTSLICKSLDRIADWLCCHVRIFILELISKYNFQTVPYVFEKEPIFCKYIFKYLQVTTLQCLELSDRWLKWIFEIISFLTQLLKLFFHEYQTRNTYISPNVSYKN